MYEDQNASSGVDFYISKLVPRTSKLKLEYNIVAFPYVQHYFLQSVLVPSNLFFDCCVSLQCFLINSFDLLSLSPFCFSVPVIFLIRTPLQGRTQSQFEKGQVSFTALQSLEMNPLVELLFNRDVSENGRGRVPQSRF